MSQSSPDRCGFSRDVALLAGGELASRRVQRVRAHLAGCRPCRSLQADLQGLAALTRRAGGLEALAGEAFHSVAPAVRARLREPRRAARTPWSLWPVLAPVAGVVLMAGFLLLAGGVGPRTEPVAGPPAVSLPAPAAASAGEVPGLSMSPIEDARSAVLTIDNGPASVHRVAVSLQGADFAGEHQVFEVTGNSFVDPTPLPEPGQVVFFRVD